MMRPTKHFLLSSCAILAFSVAVAVDAQAAPSVTTKIRPNYARMMFTWDEEVRFKPSTNGKTLTISFNKAGAVPLAKIKQSLSPYIHSAWQSGDKKTIALTMKEAYPIRSFISGSSNGVDILVKASPRPTTVVTDKAPISIKPRAKTEPILTTKKISPKPTRKPILTTKKPIPQTAPKKVEVAALYVPKPKFKPNIPEATPVEPATTKKKSPKIKNATIVAAAPVAKVEQKELPPVNAALKPKTGLPAELPPLQEASGADKKMLVTLRKGKLSGQFYFNFDERTAAAAFERGADTYLVFSTKRTIDTKRISSILPNYITSFEQLPSSNGTVLRLTRSTDIYVTARQTGRGYEWVMDTSRRSIMPKNILVPDIIAKPPVKPHMFVGALQTSKPLRFKHPVSGETIHVIPSYQASTGVFPERITPDATILRTGQGVAYVAHDAGVRYTRLRNGIRLSALEGLDVSSDLVKLDPSVLLSEEQGSNSFFPYQAWKAKNIADFYAKEHVLLQDIPNANAKKAQRLRLDLARLYMSEGMFSEAIGLLDIIHEDAPDFYDVYQLAALNGASSFMMGRTNEAVQAFNDGVLADEDEIAQWKRLMALMQGNKKVLNYFSFNKQYAHTYPPEIRRRIAILAADNALSQKKYNTVAKIFQQLDDDKLLKPVEKYFDYMMGRIEAEEGNLQAAADALQPLIDDTENRFLRARSAFTLATARYKAGMIDRPTLIATLEPLRNTWRGDGFELNLLNLLGELYVNDGKYLQGLRAWREAVTHFPDTAVAQDASARMASTFIELFNKGKADDLMPLGALALYYEFRELTPLGNEGDKMIQNLADRLAGVDLLDKAASLLEHQVTFRLEKEERSRIGARLALIYLMNREPKKTLDVLELTGYGDNDDALISKRNHLAAISYAKTGDWNTAMNLLRDDYSDEAKYIRLDIYWNNKDWTNLATIAEDILANREDITAKLDHNQTLALLKLAVAYTFRNDREQLQYLKDYFTPLIEQTDKQQSFALITSGIDPINKENIALLSDEMSKLESFLDNYSVNLSQNKLSMMF